MLMKAAVLTAAVSLAGAANAAQVFHVTVWTGTPNGILSSTTADEAHTPSGAAIASFDWTGPIDWTVTGAQNTTTAGNKMGDFLDGNATQLSNLSSALSPADFLDVSLSAAGDPYASFFRITGSYVSATDFHGTISHDDGASIYLDGANIYSHPAETSDISSPYTLTAGSRNFVVDYVEGNGSPSVLTFDAPGGVPEPATWMMMIAGFGGIGSMLRSRRRAAIAA